MKDLAPVASDRPLEYVGVGKRNSGLPFSSRLSGDFSKAAASDIRATPAFCFFAFGTPEYGRRCMGSCRVGAPITMGPSSTASKPVPSIIGEDLTITGNVSAKGEVQIDGNIEGNVRCSSLLLSERSQVIGNVVAEDVVVRGKVVGGIKALRVTLHNNCYVEGDIHHQSLAIEQGAYFEGRSRHSDEPLGEIEDAQPRLDAGKAKELGDALDADRHESRITPAYEQSERLIIEPAEDFPAREPSTGDEEAEGEAALRH